MGGLSTYCQKVALDCPTGLFLFGFQRVFVLWSSATDTARDTAGFSATAGPASGPTAATTTKSNVFAAFLETGGGRTRHDALVLVCISAQCGGLTAG